jgi:hypothetical protein
MKNIQQAEHSRFTQWFYYKCPLGTFRRVIFHIDHSLMNTFIHLSIGLLDQVSSVDNFQPVIAEKIHIIKLVDRVVGWMAGLAR